MLDKQLVIQRFTKALPTYDETVIIQPKIIEQLVEYIKDIKIYNYERILEIGAGTGMLTNKLLEIFSPKDFFINDICKDVIPFYKNIENTAGTNINFLIGDAEEIVFPNNIDLIISSSTVQWFENLDFFLQKCYESLNSNGTLILTSFGEKNFKEIKEITQTGLNYFSKNNLEEKISKYFDILLLIEKEHVVPFDSPNDILLHCKKTGVSASNTKAWTKQTLINFCKTYKEKFQINNKVYLTYHPIFLIARKK